MPITKLSIYVVIVLVFSTAVTAFSDTDNVEQHPTFINQLGFEQNFNIYRWLYGFTFETELSPKASIQVVENFNSTLMRLTDNQKKWKDDNVLSIDYSWKFSPTLIGKIMTSSVYFSDRLSGIKNEIKTNSGSLGLVYQPSRVININSQLGYKFDERFDELDNGATYLFDIRIPYIDINEYVNSFQFFIDGDEFEKRKNRDLKINYKVTRQFYMDTSDSLSVSYSKKRRDNYGQFDLLTLPIESLDEQLGKFTNVLKYHVNDQIRFNVHSDITTRETQVSRFNTDDIDLSRSKHELSTFNEFDLKFERKNIRESLKFSYLTETQKNDVPYSERYSPFSPQFSYASPDFKSSRVSLANVLHLRFSNRDSLMTNVSISRYRYDTPDDENNDDHDELRINAGITQIHYFNEMMKLSTNLGVNLKHLVFIFGERSADNNWMRIFRLSPELSFVPNKSFQWVQSLEVLANYVEYDFEQTFSPTDIRSYVFRKFSMQQAIQYQLSRTIQMNANYRLELEENGKLLWDQWKETVITTRQNHYVRSSVDYTPWHYVTFSTGFVLYERKEDFKLYESATGSGSPSRNEYFSFGPSLKLIYAPHPGLNFSLTAVRRFIDRVGQDRYHINNINLNLSWYL
ncbi:hypothetical protein JXB12_03415 [candidate division KSB1 bacterium]|nr:hypothetical protein [candidate division KSB1 bacterium]